MKDFISSFVIENDVVSSSITNLVTSFVSTFTALNINFATSDGVLPDLTVLDVSLGQEELINAFPEAFSNTNTKDDINYYDFINSGASGLVLNNYNNSRSNMQGYANGAGHATSGAYSYRGITSNGIHSSGGSANASGGGYNNAYGSGEGQGAQFPINNGVHNGENLTATLTGNRDGKSYQKLGKITVRGNTYDFASGRNSNLKYLPVGTYNVRKHLNVRKIYRDPKTDKLKNVGFVKNGVGFSFVLEDINKVGSDTMWDPDIRRTRTLLRIHPDGGNIGTSGCIGLGGSANVLRQFREDMNAELKGKRGVTLNVVAGNEHVPGTGGGNGVLGNTNIEVPASTIGQISDNYDGKRICLGDLQKKGSINGQNIKKEVRGYGNGWGKATHFGLGHKNAIKTSTFKRYKQAGFPSFFLGKDEYIYDLIDNGHGTPAMRPGGGIRKKVRKCSTGSNCSPGNIPMKNDVVGLETENTHTRGVALPQDLLEAISGKKYRDIRNYGVEVSNGRRTEVVPILDFGPDYPQLAQGKVIDLSPLTHHEFGGDQKITYCILPGYYGSSRD